MADITGSQEEAEAIFEAVSEMAAQSNVFVLNECSLMADDDPKEKDENGNEKPRRQAPIGVTHKDDGVQTPDKFSWAHSLDKWYAVWIWAGIPAVQIMTQSRLSMALGYVDHPGQEKPVSLRNVLKVTEELDYSYGPTVVPIEKNYDISSIESFERPFLFSGLPKLEHRIALPEMLFVEKLPQMNDVYTSGVDQEYESETQTFWRILPPPENLFHEERLTAKVTFSEHETDRVGHGNSAQVFRVMMEHPEITTKEGDKHAKNFVSNEGNSYAICPDYLSEAREGYIQAKPIHQPQPCCAAIPKFYGMYKDKDGQLMLLLEECGTPIRPEKLKPHHKSIVMSMLLRIHRFGIIQNSMSTRNVLMQPGPLTVPPSERSKRKPSFRIIDFGRAVHTEPKKQKYAWIQAAFFEESYLSREVNYPITWFQRGLLWPKEGEDDEDFIY
ncbi:hypothetical protein CPB86DRAFT_796137 [Serendipita vermifera]|nr:hypothetical protein CPB86DRAFT_796137 [Serendipita vermifera]